MKKLTIQLITETDIDVVVDGEKHTIDRRDFERWVDSSNGRRWTLESGMREMYGDLSWDEYYEDPILAYQDILFFLAKNIRRRNAKNTNTNNPGKVFKPVVKD